MYIYIYRLPSPGPRRRRKQGDRAGASCAENLEEGRMQLNR